MTTRESSAPQRILPTDPWMLNGEGAITRLSRIQSEWLASASPVGATAYETPIKALTLTDSRFSPYSGAYFAPSYNRVGKDVKMYGLVSVNVELTGANRYDFGMLDEGFRPAAIETFSASASAITRPVGSMSTSTSGGASTGTAHTHSISHTHGLSLQYINVRIDVYPQGKVTLALLTTDIFVAGGYLSLSEITFRVA